MEIKFIYANIADLKSQSYFIRKEKRWPAMVSEPKLNKTNITLEQAFYNEFCLKCHANWNSYVYCVSTYWMNVLAIFFLGFIKIFLLFSFPFRVAHSLYPRFICFNLFLIVFNNKHIVPGLERTRWNRLTFRLKEMSESKLQLLKRILYIFRIARNVKCETGKEIK